MSQPALLASPPPDCGVDEPGVPPVVVVWLGGAGSAEGAVEGVGWTGAEVADAGGDDGAGADGGAVGGAGGAVAVTVAAAPVQLPPTASRTVRVAANVPPV
jgi:hypothetical protein